MLIRPFSHVRFLVIIIVIVCNSIKAEKTSSISGFVRQVKNGEPISYANVFIPNSSLGTTTNSDGYFVFVDLDPGKYEINISMIGYGLYKKNVILSPSENVRLDIRMIEEILQGSEIKVTALKQKFKKSVESSNIILDFREIQNATAFVESDVFRTLQMLPGVQTTSDWSSALYVRGSTPDQNLLMLDGISVYNPYHLCLLYTSPSPRD